MGIQEQLQQAQELESREKFGDAAIIYQKIFDRDQGNRLVIGRLLVIYRKLKEYRKELAVIDDAMSNLREREKAIQQKWIRDHPKAAGIGRSMLRQLEQNGEDTFAFGADTTVNAWIKRRAFVTRKIKGYKEPARKRKNVVVIAPPVKKASAQKSRPPKENKPPPAPVREIHPSLFIISLTYMVPLEKIDAAMPGHMAYLNRHYKKGDFLVSGRKVPRTGGIIIARGTDRMTIERIVKEDPFIKRKLASADIQEFSASQVGKNLKLGKLSGD